MDAQETKEDASDPAPAWFRRHFNEDYRILYSGRTQAQADREVGFAAGVLGIRPPEVVLDVCCGYGRHLRSFQSRGIPAVGIDLSMALLREAPRGDEIARICADMRRLPFAGGADGFPVLVNFFTSFGYFERDEEHEVAAREMARALRPGGRFLIDILNPESTLARLEPRTERRGGRFRVVEERSYDAALRRIEKRIELADLESGASRHYFESVRVFREDEVRDLLERAGLEVLAVHGDFDGTEAGRGAPRLIVTGRRA